MGIAGRRLCLAAAAAQTCQPPHPPTPRLPAGNPHCTSPSSLLVDEELREARHRVLRHFNADSEEYTVVFTRCGLRAVHARVCCLYAGGGIVTGKVKRCPGQPRRRLFMYDVALLRQGRGRCWAMFEDRTRSCSGPRAYLHTPGVRSATEALKLVGESYPWTPAPGWHPRHRVPPGGVNETSPGRFNGCGAYNPSNADLSHSTYVYLRANHKVGRAAAVRACRWGGGDSSEFWWQQVVVCSCQRGL